MLKAFVILILIIWIGRALYRTRQKLREQGLIGVRTDIKTAPRITEIPTFDYTSNEKLFETEPQKVKQTLVDLCAKFGCPPDVQRFMRVYYRDSFDTEFNHELAEVITDQTRSSREYFIHTLFCVGATAETIDRVSAHIRDAKAPVGLPILLKWQLDELNVEQAINDFVAAGIINEPDEEMLMEIKDNYSATYTDDHGNEKTHDVLLLQAILQESPFALVIEGYKPGKDVNYQELFEYFLAKHTNDIELQNVDADYNEELNIASKLSLTVNGENYSYDYNGHQFLDVIWTAEIANSLLQRHKESVRCIYTAFHPDNYVLFVAEPNVLIPLMAKYHIVYYNDFDHETTPYDERPWVKAKEELRVLEKYSANSI